jgi:hypothetical protein
MNPISISSWTEISQIRRPAGEPIRLVDDALRQAGSPASRYQAENGVQAIVVPSRSLLELAGSAKSKLPEDCSEVVFLEPGEGNYSLTRLPGDHENNVGLAWPDSPRADGEVSAILGSSFRGAAVGTWSLLRDGGEAKVYRLYRLTPTHDVRKELFNCPARKLAETDDNLEERSRWFQKRQEGLR